MKSINPATEEMIAEYAEHSPAQIERILESSENAFARWRSTDITHRAALMRQPPRPSGNAALNFQNS